MTALLVAFISTALMRELARERQLEALQEQSHYEQTQIMRVFSLIQDAEIGQRGYLLSRDPAYLEAYHLALRQLDPQLGRLTVLLARDATQTRDLAQLRDTLDRKKANLAWGIRNVGAPNPIPPGGKAAMDDIRRLVDQMIAYEAQSFAASRDSEVARSRDGDRFIRALMLVFSAVLLASAFVIWRSIQMRNRLVETSTAEARRHNALFDGSQDALMVLTQSGLIDRVNPAAETMFGWTAAQMTGRDIGVLIDPDGPGDPAVLERFRDRRGQLDARLAGQITGKRRDGTTFPADISASPVALVDGQCIMAAVRDVSERRRVEEMKTQFVSTVSHELRTPLTSIAGSLGLLAGGAAGVLPEKAARLIGIAQANSQRLVRLINDILDIEKIESGQILLEMEPLDLRDVAAQSIESVRGMADGLGARLTLLDGIPAPVRGDSDRLIQVVVNLLSNAVKFSPENGEVTVVVEPANRIARLSVRDRGPGVPEEFRARIFSKFAQADGSDTRARGGTGLGLAIAREIAERHGGRLWFESDVGDGATFHLDLPLETEHDGQTADGPRLLIVEDDHDAAEVLRTMLDEDGFRADVAATARQGLSAARTGDYAAVLVDLQLPDADGIGLIRALRAQPATRDLPVVVVSGDVARGRARGYSLEVLDWLEKPFEQERLRSAVAAILARLDQRRPRLLLVEDDLDIQRLTASALSDTAEIIPVGSLAAARAELKQRRPDLVILDLGLPDGSGIELLADLHGADGSPVPVVIYSARDTDIALYDGVEAVLVKSKTSLATLARTVRRLTRKERTSA
ncbi:response regulator [Brevundimonas sp. Root1279]|uniref:response regulator n=1 Tax=Brevundimonas sp. Root1279 TaxID=1736443 RepID=UPI00138ECC9C|nr:response regulator [Brevundimonas sp. Root1279]